MFSLSVSDILRASVCPMQLYLARSSPAAFAEPLHYSVAKQLSYHLGDTLDCEAILDELTLILPEDTQEEAARLLDEMLIACEPVSWKQALAVDISVRSEKYNIHGRVDRMFDGGFAIIKGGKAPTRGVYETDRLQAVCYSVCLSEMYGKEYTASVEYLGSGVSRTVSLSPADRRMFLTVLRETERVARGEVPRAIHGSRCVHCRFQETCKPLEKPKSLFERLTRQ